MELPASEELPPIAGKAGEKHGRRLTLEEEVHLHDAAVLARKKRRLAISDRAAASIAARKASALYRSEARAIASLNKTLPPVHEANKDITAEQSQTALRIMAVVFEIMGRDPSWRPRAYEFASRGTGICERQVRDIWDHYYSTGEFYETLREARIPSPAAASLHAAARDYIERKLPILATKGVVLSHKGVIDLLQSEFGVEFTEYHVKQITDELGYQYGKVPQDWTVGMKSDRRQRQLLLHLLMLDQAMAEVKAGTAVILFTDQTFIDTCSHQRYGLWKPGVTQASFPKGTGVRVAHMHALTCYGLLAVNGDDGKPVLPPKSDETAGHRASEDALTGELTFDLKKKKGVPGEEKVEKPGFSAEVGV
jgi:hypothetical protein